MTQGGRLRTFISQFLSHSKKSISRLKNPGCPADSLTPLIINKERTVHVKLIILCSQRKYTKQEYQKGE